MTTPETYCELELITGECQADAVGYVETKPPYLPASCWEPMSYCSDSHRQQIESDLTGLMGWQVRPGLIHAVSDAGTALCGAGAAVWTEGDPDRVTCPLCHARMDAL